MTRVVDRLVSFVESVLLVMLSVMVALVFTNVVLRYAFKSGIAVADEVSRYCFVWLVFLGATLAVREHTHLGVDSVVRRLPPVGKKLCLAISHVLMLAACGIFFLGSWNHTVFGHANHMPVTGIPLSWLNSAGVVSSFAIALMLVVDLFRLATGRIRDVDLVQVAEDDNSGRP